MGKVTEIELIDDLNGWTTIRKMAENESVTVQTIYYRIGIGKYKAVALDKIILVRKKDVNHLKRRQAIDQNKV